MARSGPGEFQRVDLHAVLNDALKLAAAEFRNRIRVNADFGQLPEVECSPQAIGQVFLNILVNAGQAISGEGTVTVRSRRVGEAAEVSIADTGPGIPQEIQDRIFTPGFTTKPLGSGMGLGLKIAREIIEDLHGGTLRFESRAGSGTTFFVTIPVRRQPDGQKRSSP
jgi:signal transduction histidine kinase